MKVKYWSVKDLDKNTAYIHFSMTGHKEFDLLMKSINTVKLKKIRGVVSSYSLDGLKLERYNNQIFVDNRHQIKFTVFNGVLKINIGGFIFDIHDFDIRSKIKNLRKLSIAITYEVVSPLMITTPWELLHLIVIKGIEK